MEQQLLLADSLPSPSTSEKAKAPEASVNNLVKLFTKDQMEVFVEKELVLYFETVKLALADKSEMAMMNISSSTDPTADVVGVVEEEAIPLPEVNAKIFEKVLEYVKWYHKRIQSGAENASEALEQKVPQTVTHLEKWEVEFFKLELSTLLDLILAANYLDFKKLLNSATQIIADMMSGKTAEEIRTTFNIKNDFTPEEEEQVKRENEWCEE